MQIKDKKFVLWVLVFLFLINILAWLVVYDFNKLLFLEVIFFDIGQGDAIFIKTPKRHQILIDGGPSSAILEKLGKELPFWDRTIDLIILTHPEYDHLVGLIEVVKRYKIENILWTGVRKETAEFKEWQRLIEEERMKEDAQIKIAKNGLRINLLIYEIDRKEGYLEILFPLESLEGGEFKNTNNTSIITKLVFGENSFLFSGDAYKEIERRLIEGEVDLDSDVLKVGHHGSKTSTSEEFLKEILPEIAVISVGKENAYGHPHQEVLEILSKYGIRILRTDIDGDIKFISDGRTLKIKK